MRKVDVHDIIDNARFNRFHWLVVCLCALLLIFDGYDLFIYGVVLPVIMKEWGLTPLEAGALGSYALFGMMFGALAFGTLADRIGRKKGIAICFVLFSSATVLNGFASTPTEFGIFRFLAGLGCGGLMPNVVALMNEYAPKRLRSTLVAVMFSGYSLGGMLSAGLGIYMLPRFGWEAMFFAAAVPLLLFASGARRIDLAIIGMIQFITPIMQFLTGVLLLHEPMPPERWIGFIIVWVAVGVFVVDLLLTRRRRPPLPI